MKASAPAVVLVVDDDPLIRDLLSELLRGLGHDVKTAASAELARSIVERHSPELVLLDLRLGASDGLELLEELVNQGEMGVVMMTGHGSVGTAVEAMKRGALDFVTKPFRAQDMERAVHQALRVSRLNQENTSLRNQLVQWRENRAMIGRSRVMEILRDLISTVAPTRSNILITGESGTGKELVASDLHHLSPRREAAFIKINCAAVPPGLLESELFGFEKGAFTGAVSRGKGKFEISDGGTLLLDEISEMDLSLQPKLLRAIQEKEFYRVGGSQPVRVDVRVIATTNTDLEAMIERGEFRKDLYYRLNVVPIEVPPLRDRKEDIPDLIRHFVEKVSKENGREPTSVSPAVLERFMAHDWPGNVRELENVISRGIILCMGGELRLEHLLWRDVAQPTPMPVRQEDNLREMERQTILRILHEEKGNRTRAARRLGISVRTVRNKLAEYQPPRAANLGEAEPFPEVDPEQDKSPRLQQF
ncbi:MAG: sigma-54 dependent transcriptional regulator [Candidatus Eisenbacteria bacterium]|uniref:Sigma-54 dependent transcriptional regulator n=1 Tax=Eiseniibacteriota bacterium TaxID=2212470 RepID=A0A948RZ13_UNCEI|nr:sigma-54 dependent transcriptional regulator [Candidatus Eisenbacteria bacterium]MBU2692189.1 sigma-54 dependent transcriptional regulator [Candidatus Eisenbacteria bacterium]